MDTTVGWLRLHAVRSDRTQDARRAASILRLADIVPRGLPPRAILVVRRLPDPRPGGLFAGPAWRAADRWGAAARAALHAQWRGAARPIVGAVPPDAGAVWFADEAEWLACLSHDLLLHRVHEHWWWRSWQSTTPQPGILAALWRSEARWVPAALALLAERPDGVAAALVAALLPAEVEAVRRAMLLAYDLPPAVEQLPNPAQLSRLVPNAGPAPPVTEGGAELLILALALKHAPAAVRRLVMRREDKIAAQPPVRATEAPLPYSTAPPAPAALPATPSRRDQSPSQPPDGVGSPWQETAALPVEADAIAEARDMPIVQASQADTTAEARGVPVAQPPQDDLVTPRPGAVMASLPAEAVPDVQWPADVNEIRPVTTSLGGCWYLVNVLRNGDGGSDPFDDSPTPWAVLDRWARTLLADAPSDSLWAILEELAGTPLPDPGTADLPARYLPAVLDWLGDRRIEVDMVRPMLIRSARIYLTRTHVDVVFPLDQIDLAARLAGLDQDPGWVPALGRVIAFHFED